VATKPKDLPEPFRAEYRSRFRQWVGSVIVLFAGTILLLVANLPGLAAVVFVALVLMLIVGTLWVAGPSRQYDRIRLERAIRDQPE
jgi:flagellar biosynthesis component FlhA